MTLPGDDENSIGLTEMIKYLKKELAEAQTASVPGFKLQLDECAIELNIAVKKQGSAGLKAYVISIGGGISKEQTHKISAKFKPAEKNTLFIQGRGASPDDLEEEGSEKDSGGKGRKPIVGDDTDKF